MSKVVKAVVGVAAIAVGLTILPSPSLVLAGASMVGSALISPKSKAKTVDRQAAAATVQLGEVPRQAIFGEAATAGSLADAFNWGGKYGTDWEVLVLALADHRCEGLRGFYVGDRWVEFVGDGPVAGFAGQLSVWWRPGTEDQAVPAILLEHGPGWTPADNGAGVAYVVVAYKADDAEAKEPVWPGGRPRFLWVVRGALCYSARADGSVGGSGGQRWDQPATRTWSANPIDCRYTWARGLYACDRVGDPSQLMIGRGLSAIEAPPANVFHRANLCDEPVDGAARYTIGALVEASATFAEVEGDFAAACAGTIVQPQGSVEIDPGEARAIVATITDDDLVVGTRVSWNNGMLGVASGEWVNTVVASYVEPNLKWADHAAPVRREVADVLADRQPREERLQLGFVTDAAQAGRIAEVRRRLGRLPGRAGITLPPRLAFIEEGDWIVWHSPRRFRPRYGVDALTFRVEAWGSDAGWRHQLSLRQISASVYSDTAPLDDGSVAILPPSPPPIGAPAAGAWAVRAGYQDGAGMKTPVLIVTGSRDDRSARFVRFEYATGAAPPTDATVWGDAGVSGPDVERREIAVAPGGVYWAAVSYVVNGFQGERRVLGPVEVGALLYPDGTPVEDRQPAERGATNSANPKSPFGPGSTVGQALAYLDRIEPIGAATDLLKKASVDQDAVLRQQDRDRARLAAAQIGGLLDQSAQRVTLRNAGMVTDPDTGRIYLYGVDQNAQRVSKVEIGLDAVSGQIALRATYNDVRTLIAQAQLPPADAAALGGVVARMNAAELTLSAQTAAIVLKADAITVTQLGGVVQSVSQTLDALAGVVATKVSYSDFTPLRDRVGAAEQVLQSIGDVSSYALTVRQAELRDDAAAAAGLAALVGGSEQAQRQIVRASEVQQQLYARLVDGDAAEAAARLLLSAQVGQAVARIGTEETARAGETEALSRSLSALSADLGGVSGTVTRLSETTSAADAARSRDITQVSARIGDFGLVSVQQAFSAIANRTGKLEGRYTLAIDSDGRLQGFVLAGSTSAPATFSFIDTDLRMGTGRVIFDTGAYMQVQGIGFGAARDLLEWFGPSMPIAQCSRANATSYKTISGDAYFGGALSAGTYREQGQSTVLAPDARITIGPFRSNGRPRLIVVSYNVTAQWRIIGACPTPRPADPSVTVELYRGTDASGVLLTTRTLTGAYLCDPGFGESEPGTISEQVRSSFTVTDGAGGDRFAYFARLVGRSLTAPAAEQTLSLISTEE